MFSFSRLSEDTNFSIFSEMLSGFFGSKYIMPSPPISFNEPPELDKTGQPNSIASKSGKPKPS